MAPAPERCEDEGGSSHTPWREHDWDAILGGKGTADCYFARSGLIRKDRLAGFVPPENHPRTAALTSFSELGPALEALGASGLRDRRRVAFVLKKAHSSNAHGIHFLTGAGAARLASGPGALSATALLAAAAAVAGSYLAGLAAAGSRRLRLLAALLAAGGVAAVRESGRRSWESASRPWRELLTPGEQGKAAVWLLQRHVEPLLHEGRKFHLRVLLLCAGDLSAYVHEDVRMLVATEPFVLGQEDGSRQLSLVTNMGASRRSADYDEGCQNLPLSALGADFAHRVFSEVGEVLGRTLANVRKSSRKAFFTLPNCWELFGADVLLEGEVGRVVLLEINPMPSLAMYGTPGPELKERLCGPNPLDPRTLPAAWHRVQLPDDQ